MIAIDLDYARPNKLDEALRLLSGAGSIPLAGGQSLVPALSTASALAANDKPTLLVDISRVAELRSVTIVDRQLVIGAAVTLAAVAAACATRSVPLLGDVLLNVASAAVRNRGTLVGNLVSASPNSELPVVMVALGAVLALQSVAGIRHVAAIDFFAGPHKTALTDSEIVTEVRIPLAADRSRGAFREVALRAGAPPLCCVATCLTTSSDGKLGDVRIAAGGIAGRPIRCAEIETSLYGHSVTASLSPCFADDVTVAPSPELPHSTYAAAVLPVLIRRVVADALAYFSDAGAEEALATSSIAVPAS